MGKLRRAVLKTSEEALPRGKVVRLQFAVTLDTLVTVAIAAFALMSAVGYQVMRWRAPRSPRP